MTLDSVVEAIKNNPVRVYSIAAAALALAVGLIPGLPVAAILVLVAAILGLSEVPKSQVTPTRNVLVDKRDTQA